MNEQDKQDTLIELARQLMLKAHDGQFRRDGTTPYSVHPEAVASRVRGAAAKAAALLHDTMEHDARFRFTAEDLRSAGIPNEVIEAVRLLTRRQGQTYQQYIEDLAGHALARKVKIADLLSNLADEPTTGQIRRYAKALTHLTLFEGGS